MLVLQVVQHATSWSFRFASCMLSSCQYHMHFCFFVMTILCL